MKPRSAKAKGRKFQNEVRQKLLDAFPTLHPDNVKCSLMSESGEDIKLSPAARELIPYSFECKCQEKLQVWQALKQAQENTKPETEPALIFRRNNSEAFVVLRFDHFLNLISAPFKTS